MPYVKLNKNERKRFGVMLLCVLFAIAMWLFLALNKRYPYTVTTELVYSNQPVGKAYKALQSDTAQLKVEGSGWQLIFSKLRINPHAITVDLKNLNTKSFVLLSDQLSQINRQLESTQKVISVKPDTLFFDFSKRTNKRVPLRLRYEFKFEPQYNLAKDIKLTPDYVNISGPEEELQKINFWYTDSVHLANLKSSKNINVAISKSESGNVTVYPNATTALIQVEEFTEKAFDIPLKIINNPDYLNVQLLPKKVHVRILVGLSNYKNINEEQIQAVVDLNQWRNTKSQLLNVKLSKLPSFTKIVAVEPQKIDFLIEN